jgi:hypothetical protein
MHTMPRKFLATLLSAAIVATTATTAPARADEDVAKVLGGLLVLGVIAKAIDDRNDRKRRKATGHVAKPHVAPRPHVQPRRHAKIASRQCLTETWTHRGPRQVYAARCLQSSVRAQLPHNCLRKNHNHSGPRYYYGRRCLQHYGWRA